MGRVEVFLSLDLTSLKEALKIARDAREVGFKEFEAGTPLIKSEGMIAVRSLREEFPDSKIFADMKTMDTGSLEASLAFSAGADIMSVMAASPNETIKEAVKTAESWGREILVDTLGLKDVVDRIKGLAELGIHRICLHKGIDEGVFLEFELIDQLRELGIKIGVAGGISSSTIKEVVSKADFVMVGRAITKSKNPKESAREILMPVGLT